MGHNQLNQNQKKGGWLGVTIDIGPAECRVIKEVARKHELTFCSPIKRISDTLEPNLRYVNLITKVTKWK